MCCVSVSCHFYISNCESVSDSKGGKTTILAMPQGREGDMKTNLLWDPLLGDQPIQMSLWSCLIKQFTTIIQHILKGKWREGVIGPFSAREWPNNILPTLAWHVLMNMLLSLILYLVCTYSKNFWLF